MILGGKMVPEVVKKVIKNMLKIRQFLMKW